MKAKKIVSLVLAMMLVFALAAPAMAYTPPANSAYYLSTTEPTLDVGDTVYVSIVSNKVGNDSIAYYDIEVTVPTAKTYHVSDILDLLQNDDDYDLTFYTRPAMVLTGISQYLYAVTDDNILDLNNEPVVFGPNYPELDKIGWMFRIDDRFPLIPPTHPAFPMGYDEDVSGPIGATIDQAYVTAGQHITLYFACAKNETDHVTHYVKFSGFSHTAGSSSIAFQLFDCYCWYDTLANDYYWHIVPFDEELVSSSFTATLNGNPVSMYYYSGSYHVYSTAILSGQDNTFAVTPKYYTTQVTSDYSPYTSYTVAEYTGTGCVFTG